MKILQINTFSNGSTGSIMMNIHNKLLEKGYESYVAWARGRQQLNDNEIVIGNKFNVYWHVLYTRLTDKTGFASKRATKKLLKRIEVIKPDIIHLHNIHGYYINIEMLFEYLSKTGIKVFWTLHDCWSFTGHCAFFDSINCQKWKSKCCNCTQIKNYPKSYVDNSTWNFLRKKELFKNLNLTIVTPSIWLSNLVKMSYLKDYNVKIINNGIDTSIFMPKKSDFKNKYNLNDKKIILGVASTWDKRKGLDDFIKLSKILNEKYKIVLVGLSKKQISMLPKDVIGLKRTKNINELVEIYSAADLFFNPTIEDNYPTVNLEAQACGTTVVTYNTGGSKETLCKNGGYVMNFNEFLTNYEKIIDKKNKIIFNNKNSIEYMVSEYIKLYKL